MNLSLSDGDLRVKRPRAADDSGISYSSGNTHSEPGSPAMPPPNCDQKLKDLVRKMGDHLDGVALKRKKLHFYKHEFTGADAVTWMVNHGYAKTRAEAQDLGNRLLDWRLIHHVNDEHPFQDSEDTTYRFYHDVKRKHWRLHKKNPETRSEPVLRVSDEIEPVTEKKKKKKKKGKKKHKKANSIRLVADDTALQAVLSGSGTPKTQDKRGKHATHHRRGASTGGLKGIAQAAIVDAVVNDKEFVEHYYVTQEVNVDVDDIIWGHKKNRPHEEKEKLVQVNVLHKGNIDARSGKRYLVPIDGTDASMRAFEEALKEFKPEEDFMLIVAVRERHLPDRLLLHAADTEERTDWEFNLWLTARHFLFPVRQRLLDMKAEFMILAPRSNKAKKRLLSLVNQYGVDVVVLGQHAKNEKSRISAQEGHLRSTVSYMKSKCRCTLKIV